MTASPGLIVLLGSGETSASIRKVYHWLFERLDAPPHIAILETPAGFEPNSARVAGQIADFFKQRLQNFQPDVAVIPARKRGTGHSPDTPAILTPLSAANVIMMGPGSPSYAVRQLQNSLAWHTLNARHRLGAALIFASAATVAIGAEALPVYEIYKVGEDLHWKPGLNFLEPFGLPLTLIPHWNNNDGGADLDTSRCYMGQPRFRQLVEMLPAQRTIVGIDERTALVINPDRGEAGVMGKGSVTVTQNGRERIFLTGQTFALTELGPFHQISDLSACIPPEVWAQALAAPTQAQKVQSGPPPQILALLDQRNTARAAKKWKQADTLRADIEARGWRVIDTPAGSQLEPL